MNKAMRIVVTVAGTWLVARGAWADGWDGLARWNRENPSRMERSVEWEEKEGWYHRWLSGRLSIGAGVSWSHLTDNHRPPDREGGATYVGYLDLMKLEDDAEAVPVVTYWVARYLRLAATWERLEARVFNYDRKNPYGEHGQTDGVATVAGPVFEVSGVFPLLNDTLFPHAGLGMFIGMGDFKEDTFWHLGYPSQAAYEKAGSPGTTQRGFYREIHMEDTLGWVASAGLSWRPVEHFQVDLDVRKTWASTDCEYGYLWEGKGWDPHREGDFSFDNVAWTLAASWVF